MARLSGSKSTKSSSITITFNKVPHDPFLENSQIKDYGDALYKVVTGTLGLTPNSDFEYSYNRRTQQVNFTVSYKNSTAAGKAASVAGFINGAEISVESSAEQEDEQEEIVTQEPKRRRGRPRKGFSKNGKRLGRPAGSKNATVAAKAETTVAAPKRGRGRPKKVAAAPQTVAVTETVAAPQGNLAIDMHTLMSMMQNFVQAANANTATPAPVAAPVVADAAPVVEIAPVAVTETVAAPAIETLPVAEATGNSENATITE